MTATRTHTLDDAPRPRRAPEQTVKVTGVPRVQRGGGQARHEPLRSAGAAVVKVTPYRKTVAETVSTLTYVLEKGKAAEDDWARDVAIPREDETAGQAYHRMHAQAEAIAYQWGIRDGDGRLSAHIVLSLPNKDPKAEWDAARDAARACFPNSPYISVLHTGKDNPHVHVVVRMRDYQGKKLRIDRDTLHEYRQALALAGRARGIAVEARRYRVPTRLRDKAHVFSTAEPLRRVLDRQIAVIDDFTRSTPTQFRQACKTLARHQPDLLDAQRHRLLRAAGTLEDHPRLRGVARALTRVAFKPPSGERRRAQKDAEERTAAVVTPPGRSQEAGEKRAPDGPAASTEPAGLATEPTEEAEEADVVEARRQAWTWTRVRQSIERLADDAENFCEAVTDEISERCERARQWLRDMMTTVRLLSVMYDARTVRGLAMLAMDVAMHGGKRVEAQPRHGWQAVRQALLRHFKETQLGRRLAWHQGYRRERRTLRDDLRELKHERKALRAQREAIRKDPERSAELGRVRAQLAENAAQARDVRRELRAQRKLHKPMSAKGQRKHHVKALRTYARALRKEHKALRARRRALRAEYKNKRAQHNAEARAARHKLGVVDKASKQALQAKRRELATEQKEQARQYKALRKQLAAGSAELRQARHELRERGQQRKQAMREARLARANELAAARQRLGPRRVALDKARTALVDLAVSMKLHRHELAHLATVRKGVAREERRSLAESGRIIAALARSTTPSAGLREEAAQVRQRQAVARSKHEALRQARAELAHAYRQLPRQERTRAQRAEIAALDAQRKATRAELAELAKRGKALVRKEQGSLELVLRHARLEDPGLTASDTPGRMRWRSEKGRHLLVTVAHKRHKEELRQDLATLASRRKELRALARAIGKDPNRREQLARTKSALDLLRAGTRDVRRELRAEARLRKPLTGEEARKQHGKALRQHARELRDEYKALRTMQRRQRQALRTTEGVLARAAVDRARAELAELGRDAKVCREAMSHVAEVRKALARKAPGSLTESARVLGAVKPAERLRDRAAAVRERETVARDAYASLRQERKALALEYKAALEAQGPAVAGTRQELAELDRKIKATRAELGELRSLGKAHRRSEQSSLELVRRSIARGRDNRYGIEADKLLGHVPSARTVPARTAELEPRTVPPREREAPAAAKPTPARDHVLAPAAASMSAGSAERRQTVIERALDKLGAPPTTDRLATRRAMWTLATNRQRLTDADRRRLIDQLVSWDRTPAASQEAGRYIARCQQVASRIATHDDKSGRLEHYLHSQQHVAAQQRAAEASEPARAARQPGVSLDRESIAKNAQQRAEAREQAAQLGAATAPARGPEKRAEVERAAQPATLTERARAHLDRAIATVARFPDQASKEDREHAAKALERLQPYLSASQRDALRQQAARLATDARYARLGKALERIAQTPAREQTPARKPSPAPTRTPTRDRTPLSPRR